MVIKLFKWSVSIVTTRSLAVEGNPPLGGCGLVPLWLADHKDGGAVLVGHQSDVMLGLRQKTMEAVPTDEQL